MWFASFWSTEFCLWTIALFSRMILYLGLPPSAHCPYIWCKHFPPPILFEVMGEGHKKYVCVCVRTHAHLGCTPENGALKRAGRDLHSWNSQGPSSETPYRILQFEKHNFSGRLLVKQIHLLYWLPLCSRDSNSCRRRHASFPLCHASEWMTDDTSSLLSLTFSNPSPKIRPPCQDSHSPTSPPVSRHGRLIELQTQLLLSPQHPCRSQEWSAFMPSDFAAPRGRRSEHVLQSASYSKTKIKTDIVPGRLFHIHIEVTWFSVLHCCRVAECADWFSWKACMLKMILQKNWLWCHTSDIPFLHAVSCEKAFITQGTYTGKPAFCVNRGVLTSHVLFHYFLQRTCKAVLVFVYYRSDGSSTEK